MLKDLTSGEFFLITNLKKGNKISRIILTTQPSNLYMPFYFLLFFIISCTTGHHIPHHHTHPANAHMHKKDHKSLIASFEDPRRDEWQKPDFVLKMMGSLKGKTIVDIGSGSGYFTKFFLKEHAKVVAADVDKKFLDHILSRFPENDSELKTKLIKHDDPMLEKNTYDFVFTSNTYHHLDNRVEYLKQVKSGLKLFGKVVIVDFKKEPKKTFGPSLEMRIPTIQVVQELMSAGFDGIQIFELELDHQFLILGTRVN